MKNTFIPQFWQNNIVVKPANNNSEYSQLDNSLSLDDICVIKEYRKIRNDHTFSYEGKFYLINSPIRTSIAKQKIEIKQSHHVEIVAYFAGRQLDIAEVIEPTKNTPYDFEIQKN